MPVGFSTVLFAFSLARSILRDRHHTKDCVEQGPKGFEFHRFPGKLVATPPFERMSTCHARKEQAGGLISQRTKNLKFPSCWSRYGNRSYPNRALPVDRRTRVKPDKSSLSKDDNGKSQSTVIRSLVNRRLLCVSRIEHTIECSNYTLLASGLWSIQGQSCNQRLSQIFR